MPKRARGKYSRNDPKILCVSQNTKVNNLVFLGYVRIEEARYDQLKERSPLENFSLTSAVIKIGPSVEGNKQDIHGIRIVMSVPNMYVTKLKPF